MDWFMQMRRVAWPDNRCLQAPPPAPPTAPPTRIVLRIPLAAILLILMIPLLPPSPLGFNRRSCRWIDSFLRLLLHPHFPAVQQIPDSSGRITKRILKESWNHPEGISLIIDNYLFPREPELICIFREFGPISIAQWNSKNCQSIWLDHFDYH